MTTEIDVEALLAEWNEVKDDEDLRKVNAFLWQHPQDLLKAVEQLQQLVNQKDVALAYYEHAITMADYLTHSQQDEIDHLEYVVDGKQDIIDVLQARVLELMLDRPYVDNINVDNKYSGA